MNGNTTRTSDEPRARHAVGGAAGHARGRLAGRRAVPAGRRRVHAAGPGPPGPFHPPPDVVERVLDERPVVGFGPYDSPLRWPPVHRAVPALAPLADLAGFRWRPGRLAATR